MNREVFFAAVRTSVFGGRMSQQQVDGISDLLDVWDRSGFSDQRWLAYILAGVFHEVGGRMVPVREGFAATDAGARAAVAKLHAAGRISRNYALPVNGVSYYARGRIQNTHHENYVKLQKRFGRPFVTQPDLLLDSKIDAEVTIYGHAEGIWTGKKLSDYFNTRVEDPVGARRIVNGTDKALIIAGYYRHFLAALKKAADTPAATVPVFPFPFPAPDVPLPDLSDLVPKPKSWLARIVLKIASWFIRKGR